MGSVTRVTMKPALICRSVSANGPAVRAGLLLSFAMGWEEDASAGC